MGLFYIWTRAKIVKILNHCEKHNFFHHLHQFFSIKFCISSHLWLLRVHRLSYSSTAVFWIFSTEHLRMCVVHEGRGVVVKAACMLFVQAAGGSDSRPCCCVMSPAQITCDVNVSSRADGHMNAFPLFPLSSLRICIVISHNFLAFAPHAPLFCLLLAV